MMMISTTDRLVLEGIRALTNRYNAVLEDLAKEVADIIGDDPPHYDLSNDFIYSSDSVDQLLARLEIEVHSGD